MDKRALGKGLSALIPERQQTKSERVAFLRTDLINDNSHQPRMHYDIEKIEDLKKSIKEQGILQPILVREKSDGYEVIAGERRLKAARALGLEEVPVIIKEVSDKDAFVIALIENIQREELNPIEEAEAYQKLINQFEYTQEQVAESVSKNRSTVTNSLRLLKLPEDIKQSVFNGDISMGHARALLGADSSSEQKRIHDLILRNNISVREVEAQIKVQQKNQKQTKEIKEKSPQIVEIQDGLQKILGTKVIVDSKKKRGKIVIEYYSLEELKRIVGRIIQ